MITCFAGLSMLLLIKIDFLRGTSTAAITMNQLHPFSSSQYFLQLLRINRKMVENKWEYSCEIS